MRGREVIAFVFWHAILAFDVATSKRRIQIIVIRRNLAAIILVIVSRLKHSRRRRCDILPGSSFRSNPIQLIDRIDLLNERVESILNHILWSTFEEFSDLTPFRTDLLIPVDNQFVFFFSELIIV